MSARHFLRRAAQRASSAQAGSFKAARAATNYLLPSPALRVPCTHSLSLHQRFSYATRSAAADGYLVDVLKSEIEHELREEVNKKGSLRGSAAPFELADKAGTEEVILRRNFGKEQIAITCLVESQFPDEDEEAEQEATEHEDEQSEEGAESAVENKQVEVLHLSVIITKDTPMPALEFECTYVRGAEEVDIKSVNFLTEEPAEDDTEPQPYTGPDVDDLDERLQQAFHQLLKARGLTPKVATYVLDYLTVKEHREYMRWLHNVETFFSS